MVIDHTWGRGGGGVGLGKNQSQNLKTNKLSFEWNIIPLVSKHLPVLFLGSNMVILRVIGAKVIILMNYFI